MSALEVARRISRCAVLHPPAIQVNRACAALAVIASFLRPPEVQIVAHQVEQRRAGIDVQLATFAVDHEANGQLGDA